MDGRRDGRTEGRTDERTNGRREGRREVHDHTIIRTVFKKRSYKKESLHLLYLYSSLSVFIFSQSNRVLIVSLQLSLFLHGTVLYAWHGTNSVRHFSICRFPIFIYHSDSHDIYGMPIHGNTGFKIGVDAGGHLVKADSRTFIPDPVREQNCLKFMQECLPTVLKLFKSFPAEFLYEVVCLV